MALICIEDFCGREGYQFWADYDTDRKITTFGGLWECVPDMPSETQPSNSDVNAWALRHINIEY